LVRLKSGLFFPDVLDALGIESLTTYTDKNATWENKLFDTALAIEPLKREQRCQNPVCHRVTFLYSLLYEHEQLNVATHDTLHELFGAGNITTFEHLGKMVRAGHLVSASGAESYLGQPERLKIPLCFVHGALNACYLPESTARTYAWLSEHNGPELYTRHVVPEFGHIDCIFGQNAASITFPLMLAHLEKTAGV
jgi:cholesterol oxidase